MDVVEHHGDAPAPHFGEFGAHRRQRREACVVPFAVVLLADGGPGSLTDSALGLVERCVVILDVMAIGVLARWSRASATVAVAGR
ncbi:hypothetical protein ACFT2C_07790 [Promicromonospora sp. NPDC057138]|uniref:hypothetical protein n=1 Tax=Promicromonospora sp. NPDC057138 TaxID=3346031 RepID=UPI003645A0BE